MPICHPEHREGSKYAGQPALPENYDGVGQSLPLVVAEQQLAAGFGRRSLIFGSAESEMRRSSEAKRESSIRLRLCPHNKAT